MLPGVRYRSHNYNKSQEHSNKQDSFAGAFASVHGACLNLIDYRASSIF